MKSLIPASILLVGCAGGSSAHMVLDGEDLALSRFSATVQANPGEPTIVILHSGTRGACDEAIFYDVALLFSDELLKVRGEPLAVVGRDVDAPDAVQAAVVVDCPSCGEGGAPASYTVTGTAQFDELSPDRVEGVFDLEIAGDLPDSTNRTVLSGARLEVAATVAGPDGEEPVCRDLGVFSHLF